MAAREMSMGVVPMNDEVGDIGGSGLPSTILDNIRSAFAKVAAGKDNNEEKYAVVMPDELLYDDDGLDIWAEIIFTKGNYQTQDEINLFERYSPEIAEYMPNGTTMFDIGAGDMKKVNILLTHLNKIGRKATYLGLDISQDSLLYNIHKYAPGHEDSTVSMAGLWGNFDLGRAYCSALPDTEEPRIFLSLGSVFFNNRWDNAVDFLKEWAAVMRPQDLILAGMDSHEITDDKIWAAYHAREDLFRAFFENGLKHANKLLKEDVFRPEDWSVPGEIDEEDSRHVFYLTAERDVVVGAAATGTGKELAIKKGTKLEWFDAHKRTQKMVEDMCAEAGLEVIKSWAIAPSEMRQYLIRRVPEKGAETVYSDSDSGIVVVHEV
ncbi:hypothetical protein CkaCkLH20_06220 [Colletotrichum karsti]|uniref:Histidine-specific methyltransferase SAM-dependent domain-containing protein n=1 Tax=Colletotrichum karsti TaxID=1095194 RepID=A0A9P6I5T7_9PEZI|nr:uncharacterized protein CkaCkLH20_06220 [Colletotrichum karsti]KAF9876277.1 hypothetical protein CkaCkLH20_06220 [Colletotrichum karsti]